MDEPQPFEIHIDPNPALCSVSINGQNYTDYISAAEIHFGAGQMPSIVLRQSVNSVVEGSGFIYIVQPPDPKDVAKWAIELLKSIDSEKIESVVLDKLEWGENSTVAATIRTLIEIFSETA
jgi:hypothetical protein